MSAYRNTLQVISRIVGHRYPNVHSGLHFREKQIIRPFSCQQHHVSSSTSFPPEPKHFCSSVNTAVALSFDRKRNEERHYSWYGNDPYAAWIVAAATMMVVGSQEVYCASNDANRKTLSPLQSVLTLTSSTWEPIPAPSPQQQKPATVGQRYNTLADMVEDVFPSLCKIQGAIGDRQLGGGSGFVITEDGVLVTNDHVFQAMAQAGAREIQAIFDDGRAYRIEPLAADAEADIAIGRIIAPAGTRFKPLRIGKSANVRRGDTVAVLGAPLGGSLVPAVGVLGGTRFVADDEVMNYVLNSRADWCLLQVDANMSSGSSGGPIVNADGDVIGVSVLVQTAGTLGVGNLNYGVAIDQAYPILRELLKRGKVTRAAIGMTIVLVDHLAYTRELSATGVSLLPPKGTAASSAIPGTWASFSANFGGGGSESNSGSNSGNSSSDASSSSSSSSSSIGADAEYRTGLLVTYTVPDKPAELAGVREGDVILEINGRRMTRKGDYFAALGPVYEPGKELQCKVWRPGSPRSAGGRGGGQIVTTTIVPVVRDDVATSVTARRRGGWWHR